MEKIRRRNLVWIVVVLGIVSSGVYAYTAWPRRKSQAKETSLARAEKGAIESWFREIGRVEPKTKVDVKSSVTGKVTQVFVTEGDRVRKKQALAVVQPGRNEAEGYLASTVYSPMDGVVIKRKTEVGDAVVSGMAEFGAGNVLVTVADLSRMIVKLEVNEVDVAKLEVGQRGQIQLDAFPGETFEGGISFIAPMAEENEQKVKVFRTEVEIPRRDPRLRPGMTAHVKVLIARKEKTVFVPLEALFEEGDGWVVYVQGAAKDAAAQKRRVRLGLQNDVQAEVLSGLAGGESLLLKKPEG